MQKLSDEAVNTSSSFYAQLLLSLLKPCLGEIDQFLRSSSSSAIERDLHEALHCFLSPTQEHVYISVTGWIPYSGKYWRGRNIGGFGGLKKNTKFIPAKFLSYVSSTCFVEYRVKMSLLRYFKKDDRLPA